MDNINIKKTILIDLDGVLNDYRGDFDKNYIPKIKKGAIDFLKELHKNFVVKIFTTRDSDKTKQWICENKISEFVSGVTNTKELAFLIIDDRCIKFNGDYNQTLAEINNFKAWYKQKL